MIYLHFIVNPISGKGKHTITKEYLATYFSEGQYKIRVDYSEYKKHAVLLTQNAIAENPDVIIACGGDGTINEVASCLVNTSIRLGIIPVGSGNGLASNLNIPRNMEQAIAIIRKQNGQAIDVGKINDRYFFSNMGLGIDALIIRKYECFEKRTLSAYVKASLRASAEFKPPKMIVKWAGQEKKVAPFLFFVSNSNEMGYNMSLTPKASLSDGWLDLLIVSELNIAQKMMFGTLVLLNKTDKFKKAERFLVKELEIVLPEAKTVDLQADGEYYHLDNTTIRVAVLEKALTVLVDSKL